MKTTDQNEAYKLITGTPAIDAVSKAAKGEVPQTDEEQRMEDSFRKDDPKGMCGDINEAYANLFESLSVILRQKL